MNQGGVTPFKLPLVYWHWQWLIYSLTHIQTQSTNWPTYSTWKSSNESATQLATRTWTTQALKKIKNQGQHDSLSALGQLKSKLQQQSSSLFWCRSILYGSTGHPVQLQQQTSSSLLPKNSVRKYGPSGLENQRRGLNKKTLEDNLVNSEKEDNTHLHPRRNNKNPGSTVKISTLL